MKKRTMKRTLAGCLVIVAGFFMVVPVKASPLENSRIVGDANGDYDFNIKDLVRIKRYVSNNIETIDLAGDLDWNDAITLDDIAVCKSNLVNNTVVMEMPVVDGALKVIGMEQDGMTVKMKLKNTSNVWVTDAQSKAVFAEDGVESATISIGQMDADAEKECSITLKEETQKVAATLEAEYWSIPVK